MKEYIEREAVIKMLGEHIEVEWNQDTSPVSWAHAFSDVIDMLEDFPAADVVESVRGEWVYSPTGETVSGTDATMNEMCSVCGERAVEDSNFCPNCGADMRGDKNDEVYKMR